VMDNRIYRLRYEKILNFRLPVKDLGDGWEA
jgi:hypothetical protein